MFGIYFLRGVWSILSYQTWAEQIVRVGSCVRKGRGWVSFGEILSALNVLLSSEAHMESKLRVAGLQKNKEYQADERDAYVKLCEGKS